MSHNNPVFLCMTQVWGREFTSLFGECVLPSFVSEKNLGCGLAEFEFLIFTTPDDAAFLKTFPSYERLQECVKVRFEYIDQQQGKDFYVIMNDCQEAVAKEAEERDIPAVYLQPDAMITDGCLQRLVELWQSGYRCVMVPGIRATKETFVPALLEQYPQQNGVITAPPRGTVDLLMNNLHHISESLLSDSKTFTTHPSHIYFKDEQKGMAAVCAHVHPLLVHAQKKCDFSQGTLDDKYVDNVISDSRQIYVVYNSDEFAIVEISSREKTLGDTWYKENRLCLKAYYNWLLRSTTQTQIRLRSKPYLIKGSHWEENSKVIKTAKKLIKETTGLRLIIMQRWRNLNIKIAEKSHAIQQYFEKIRENEGVINTGIKILLYMVLIFIGTASRIRANAVYFYHSLYSTFKKVKIRYWISYSGVEKWHPTYLELTPIKDIAIDWCKKLPPSSNIAVIGDTYRLRLSNCFNRFAGMASRPIYGYGLMEYLAEMKHKIQADHACFVLYQNGEDNLGNYSEIIGNVDAEDVVLIIILKTSYDNLSGKCNKTSLNTSSFISRLLNLDSSVEICYVKNNNKSRILQIIDSVAKRFLWGKLSSLIYIASLPLLIVLSHFRDKDSVKNYTVFSQNELDVDQDWDCCFLYMSSDVLQSMFDKQEFADAA